MIRLKPILSSANFTSTVADVIFTSSRTYTRSDGQLTTEGTSYKTLAPVINFKLDEPGLSKNHQTALGTGLGFPTLFVGVAAWYVAAQTKAHERHPPAPPPKYRYA